jgi:hypothetical protein
MFDSPFAPTHLLTYIPTYLPTYQLVSQVGSHVGVCSSILRLSTSFSNGAQYVILHNKNLFDDEKPPKYDSSDQENSCTIRIIRWRKIPKIWRFESRKSFFGSTVIAHTGWSMTQQQCPGCAEEKKSVINRIWLMLSISDWSIIMICPGGFGILLVPSPPPPTHLLFCVPEFQFYGWSCEINKKLNLDVKNIFAAPLEVCFIKQV